jgi:hypothetical protein
MNNKQLIMDALETNSGFIHSNNEWTISVITWSGVRSIVLELCLFLFVALRQAMEG